MRQILSKTVVGISELKKNPIAALNSANGGTVCVLNRNTPVFYMVPADMYEKMFKVLQEHVQQQKAMELMGDKQ